MPLKYQISVWPIKYICTNINTARLRKRLEALHTNPVKMIDFNGYMLVISSD